MPSSPASFRPSWLPARQDQRRAEHKRSDDRRGTAASRGYDSKWRRARRQYLAEHPLCVCCLAHDHAMAANTVDHIVPHDMDLKRFWSRRNWQALCGWCHSAVKQPLEAAWRRGEVGVDLLGLARPVSGWLHPGDRRGG